MGIPARWQSLADRFRRYANAYPEFRSTVYRCEQPRVRRAVRSPAGGYLVEDEPNPRRFGVHDQGGGPGAEEAFRPLAQLAGEMLLALPREQLTAIPDRVLDDLLAEPMAELRWFGALPYIMDIKPRRLSGFISEPADFVAPDECIEFPVDEAFATSDHAIHKLFTDVSAVQAETRPPTTADIPPLQKQENWTQAAADQQLQEFVNKHRDAYNAALEGKPGAQKTAKALFGRNSMAKRFEMSGAIVSNSPVYKTIKNDLFADSPRRGKREKIGHDIAIEEKSKRAGDQTMNSVYRDEAIRGVQSSGLGRREKTSLLEALQNGDQTPEEVLDTLEALKTNL